MDFIFKWGLSVPPPPPTPIESGGTYAPYCRIGNHCFLHTHSPKKKNSQSFSWNLPETNAQRLPHFPGKRGTRMWPLIHNGGGGGWWDARSWTMIGGNLRFVSCCALEEGVIWSWIKTNEKRVHDNCRMLVPKYCFRTWCMDGILSPWLFGMGLFISLQTCQLIFKMGFGRHA